MRKPFSLTYVEYEDGNAASFALAIFSLTPIFSVVALVSAFTVTRRLHWMWATAGFFLVDLLCRVLKHVINQPRPEGSYRDGPGMPSEHAATSAFLAVDLSLHILARFQCSLKMKVALWVTLMLWVVLVCASRFHNGVHSLSQVIVGSVIGFLAGVLSAELRTALSPRMKKVQDRIEKLWLWLGGDDAGRGHKD